MPHKAIPNLFARLFGVAVDGADVDDFAAHWMSNGKMTAREITRLSQIDRAKLVAQAESLTFQEPRNLTEIFGVSVTAMALRLLQLGLVS
jgi:hypothetical protein